ncbi:aldehyde dehydrogenase family protein [Candidatus Woesearchaeota archaeon]|nr:aldehyde dehydrogenase family protein [Candidatus Woesearchaeota archaeon]
MFIAGEWIGSKTGKLMDILNPYTEKIIARVPESNEEDAAIAAKEAKKAYETGIWSRATPAERQAVLLRIADLLEKNKDRLSALESQNQGKTIKYARDSDLPFLIDTFRFFAGAARTLSGMAAQEYSGMGTSFIRREPIGVVACIIPWNYPLYIAAWQIAPALAAGNSVVAKPASSTPLTLLEFAALAKKAGLPDGVLNIITGKGEIIGKALAEDKNVDMITFTGDTSTGRNIMAMASSTLKVLHLELGGKAPAIVLPDADLDAAAEGCAVGAFWNAGQDCTAVTRVLVHKSQHDALVKRLVSIARQFRLGNQLHPATDMGPLVSKKQQDRVKQYVDIAVRQGAKIECGGKTRSPGCFFEPTILTNVRQHDTICQEEVFGPVLIVQKYKTTDDALQKANDIQYGLAASVWGSSIRECIRIANNLKFGTVWINEHGVLANEMPHGGCKQSGFGKDMSVLSLEEYTKVKHVYIDQLGIARKPWHYVVYGKK